jgi:hypothetical protein
MSNCGRSLAFPLPDSHDGRDAALTDIRSTATGQRQRADTAGSDPSMAEDHEKEPGPGPGRDLRRCRNQRQSTIKSREIR